MNRRRADENTRRSPHHRGRHPKRRLLLAVASAFLLLLSGIPWLAAVVQAQSSNPPAGLDDKGFISAPLPIPVVPIAPSVLGNSSELLVILDSDGRGHTAQYILTGDKQGLFVTLPADTTPDSYRLFKQLDYPNQNGPATTASTLTDDVLKFEHRKYAGDTVLAALPDSLEIPVLLVDNLLSTRLRQRYEFELKITTQSKDGISNAANTINEQPTSNFASPAQLNNEVVFSNPARVLFELTTLVAPLLEPQLQLDSVQTSWIFPDSFVIESFSSSEPSGKWQLQDRQLTYSASQSNNAMVRVLYSQSFDDLADSDADNIADEWDRCPGTAQNLLVDRLGCTLDLDDDSVPDSLDLCPDTQKATIVDQTGCESDSDSDGVADSLDQCRGTSEKAIVSSNGCARDTDADSIPDYRDVCSNTTAKPSAVSAFGCRNSQDLVLDDVRFRSGNSGLDQRSRDSLDRLAEAMLYQNSLQTNRQRYEIAAFTDNRGSRENNRALSRRRANTVRHYLLLRGINPQLLEAKGYGERNARAGNDTVSGRRINRRIEIRLLN